MFVTGSRFVVLFVQMVFLLSLSTFAAEEYENATSSPAAASEPVVTDGIDYDHDDFEDHDSTSAAYELYILYAVVAGAAVLGSVVLVYACKVCLERNRRWQQARHFGTIVLPPQFPLNNIPRIQLVNQE